MATRFLGLMVVSLALVSACGEQAPATDITKGQIGADLKEHTIAMTATEVRAGTVTFIVHDRGSLAHDFIVIKTDVAPDKLAVDSGTQKAKEDGRVGGLQEIAPGKSMNLRLDLAPGHYVIICNVPTHYELGMRTALTVR